MNGAASCTVNKLWRIEAYRLALFIIDLGWQDLDVISKTVGMRYIADQLYRSLGSISANIAEGFSRRSPLEKARFYEYALGSARESRGWYYKSRHIIDMDKINQRYRILSSIIRLLITMIPQQRNQVREDQVKYEFDNEGDLLTTQN